MARKQVVEIECARCARVEYQDADGAMGVSDVPVFEGRLALPSGTDDIRVRFSDLCSPCLRTVKALIEQIGRKIDGVSPNRPEKKVSEAKKRKEEPTRNGPTPPPPQGATSKKPAS